MFLRTEKIVEKCLVGQRVAMTFANDRTFELWSGFMPRRKAIANALLTDLYCLQVYKGIDSVLQFDPQASFQKWAAVEVPDFTSVPEGMESFLLPAGEYAVFLHKGAAATAPQTFRYIFGTWLPQSGHLLDDRPHFEILGAKYKNNDPESEEEIWIPVKVEAR